VLTTVGIDLAFSSKIHNFMVCDLRMSGKERIASVVAKQARATHRTR
jgi:hypothetical protein